MINKDDKELKLESTNNKELGLELGLESTDNGELELEPIDDDELELEPIEDDDAKKQIASDIPFNSGVRLIPVICSACRTRLYAGEDQVGLWKRCPDCERLTEIRAVPPKFILTADDPEAAGGYNVQDAEVTKQDIARLKAKHLNDFEENQKILERERQENKFIPKVYVEETPIMEGLLNHLLKSSDEKKEEKKILKREQQIETEVEAIKKAARDGKLDELLASQMNNQQKAVIDPAERKRIEKQRQFEAAKASSTTLSSQSSSQQSSQQYSSQSPQQKTPQQKLPPPLSKDVKISKSADQIVVNKSISTLSMLLDKRCRARMFILTICGLIGNLAGEKARSMIWQVSIDKIYEQIPGYVYTWAERGFLFINFWVGAVLTIVWLCMLFLFGISFFDASAAGKDKVERWTPFNLDFGCSYIGWAFLILFVSGFPGYIVWRICSFFLTDYNIQLMVIHYIGQFFCFPILFLCVIESNTFYGDLPIKTLKSLYQRPMLWFKTYCKSAVFVGIPVTIIVGLAGMGTAYYDYWFMHSVYYYFIASVLLTFCGYFVLFYFRLLGKTASEINLEV